MALTHSYSGLSVSGGLSLSPSASSFAQSQFQQRRWCYIEKVLRGATILHDDWDKEAGLDGRRRCRLQRRGAEPGSFHR